MAHLMQLRTPKGTHLMEVMKTLANEGWNEISEFFEPGNGSAESYRREFFEKISAILEPCLKAYNQCGTSAVCSDEVEGGPWLNYNDEIVLLYLEDRLPAIVDNLAFVGLDSVIHALKPGSRRNAFLRLHKVFNNKLNSYLYYNPVCRNIDFCAHSVPASIWKQ